jgi:integrase
MSVPTRTRTSEGITVRHLKGCRTHSAGRCNCTPTYLAEAYDRRAEKRHYKGFPTLVAAKAWRADAQRDIRTGVRRGPSGVTLHQAASEWLAGAEDGSVRNRSGKPYKPSVVSSYRQSLVNRVLPALGALQLQEIDRPALQQLVDRLLADGLDPSTICNHLMPLRVIFRRNLARGTVAINPTTGLELPSAEGRRERIAHPDEAERLLAALPYPDRAIWATALYAGLRSGELQALAWDCVDLASGIIRVERSYDPKSHVMVDPKSKAGRRRVPIPAILRDVLVEHRMDSAGVGLVFGRTGERPFGSERTDSGRTLILIQSDCMNVATLARRCGSLRASTPKRSAGSWDMRTSRPRSICTDI